MSRKHISVTVNGTLHRITGKYAFLPVSDFLRYELGLTGTKVVCAEGDCGACTVLFKRRAQQSEKFQSINTCIVAGLLMDGCHIVTVEGLGTEDEPGEVQSAMVRNFGAQCGFCTPGFVMSIANLYEQKTSASEQTVKNYLTGNLCRCTGYEPILKAALDVDTNAIQPLSECYAFEEYATELEAEASLPIHIQDGDKAFFAPTSLAMASEYKKQYPDLVIISGATDLGVQVNKGKEIGKRLMSLQLISELKELSLDADWVSVGAGVSLSRLQAFLEEPAPAFSRFLNIFASPQIKNVATLVGNVANGSPIADTTPYLLTADAEVSLLGSGGQRRVPLTDFVLGYKKFDLQPDEFITQIHFRLLREPEHAIGLYKISQRRDLDISCVNASFAFRLNEGCIEDARIVFGGVGPRTLRLSEIEQEIQGKTLDEALKERIKEQISSLITPISDVRGSAQFRGRICQDLFERFVQEEINA